MQGVVAVHVRGQTVIPVTGTPIDVVAEDFTGDGRFDLAVSVASAASIVVLRNDGTSFTAPPPTPVGQTPNYLVSADFNRDGRADLVVSNAGSGSVSVLFATGTGFTVQDFAAGTAPTALLAQDLTGDGLADILVTSLISGDFPRAGRRRPRQLPVPADLPWHARRFRCDAAGHGRRPPGPGDHQPDHQPRVAGQEHHAAVMP